MYFIFIYTECIQELYDSRSNTLTRDTSWDEVDELIVLEYFLACPWCRQNIGGREKWKCIDEAITKMNRDLVALDKRVQVSDLDYRDRLRRTNLELQELKRKNDELKLQLQEAEFKLKLKTSRLEFKELKERKASHTGRRLAMECGEMASRMTSVFDEDVNLSNEH